MEKGAGPRPSRMIPTPQPKESFCKARKVQVPNGRISLDWFLEISGTWNNGGDLNESLETSFGG